MTSRRQQGCSPYRCSREILSLPLSASAGGQLPWLEATSLSFCLCLHITPFLCLYLLFCLSHMSLCPSCIIRTIVILFRTHPDNIGWKSHLKILNDICKTFFFKRGNSQGLGHGYILLGATIQPTIPAVRYFDFG